MTRDRFTGLISVLIGAWLAFATSMLPKSKMLGDIGPKVFPAIAAGLLIICGIGLLIAGKEKSKPMYSKHQLKRLIFIFSLLLGYVVAMHLVGFIVPTLIAAFILSTMFSHGHTEVALWKRLLYAVLITGILYGSFAVLLKMKLPSGILF